MRRRVPGVLARGISAGKVAFYATALRHTLLNLAPPTCPTGVPDASIQSYREIVQGFDLIVGGLAELMFY